MIAALGLLTIASAVMLLLFMRTMDELRHGRDDAGIVQTLLVAQGGSNIGVALLRNDVRYQLDDIVAAQSDSVGAWSFGNSNATAQMPTPQSVAQDMAIVASLLQPKIDALICGNQALGGGSLSIRIHVTDTACGEPLPPDMRLGVGRFVSGYRRELGGNQLYALPFVMVSDGVQGEYRRRVVTQGEYQFNVGRRSFARYALFTNQHMSESGSELWFTKDTLFDGPVHTNGNYRFHGNPWFGGAVSSAGATLSGYGQGAFGYGTRFYTASQLDPGGNYPHLGGSNRPEFVGGVDWRADRVDLPNNAHDQLTLAQQHGIYFPQNLYSLELYASDADGNPTAVGETSAYQYVVAETDTSPRQTIRYRISPAGVLERQNPGSPPTWTVITTTFNGLIYAREHIPRLRGPGRTNASNPDTALPALASFSQLTIVPERGARITSDLIYADQPCVGSLHRSGNTVVRPTCDNINATNVLGIFAPTGDIQIGNHSSNTTMRAPRDVRIQASLLTSNGVTRVENYNSTARGNQGAVQLLGGIIEQRYGAFFTFNTGSNGSSTPVSGYTREFTFDPRMGRGLTPPYFPTVGKDGVTDTATFTFGHREQVF